MYDVGKKSLLFLTKQRLCERCDPNGSTCWTLALTEEEWVECESLYKFKLKEVSECLMTAATDYIPEGYTGLYKTLFVIIRQYSRI